MPADGKSHCMTAPEERRIRGKGWKLKKYLCRMRPAETQAYVHIHGFVVAGPNRGVDMVKKSMKGVVQGQAS